MALEKTSSHGPRLGPRGARFSVWAPKARRLAVRIGARDHPMTPEQNGFFSAEVAGARAGATYQMVFEDGRVRPDPASRRQPFGVHGPSQVFDADRYAWRYGAWKGLPLEELIFYELHVGTFTEQGTLDAAGQRLPDLAELGITCVELMPVQPFPGERNWGYDGVAPYAVHEAYGGPEALQRFVDRAHGLGLAVCLDVVYNHLGPEGAYHSDFGPYFTQKHKSPWGDGLNTDGVGSEQVRGYFVDAALQWVRDFRVDVLRLDAVQAIQDDSPRHLVAELCDEVRALAQRTGRHVHVVAESDLNDRKVVDPPPDGWGAHAMWADDLHHALHALVTGERSRYYRDFGRPEDVARALAEGFVYQGQYSRYRSKVFGTETQGLPPSRFVICAQNHDQIGNRALGERLSTLVAWDALAPLAALVLLAPGLPLIFMGEEYGETRPFLYFTSHTDPALARAVSEGRRREFVSQVPQDEIPDPQDPATFARSKLTHRLDGEHGELRRLYRELLALRRRHLPELARRWPAVSVNGYAFTVQRAGLEVAANLGVSQAAGLPSFGWKVRELTGS
jgi:maltooligosyltrehalose trehalohydrolase